MWWVGTAALCQGPVPPRGSACPRNIRQRLLRKNVYGARGLPGAPRAEYISDGRRSPCSHSSVASAVRLIRRRLNGAVQMCFDRLND